MLGHGCEFAFQGNYIYIYNIYAYNPAGGGEWGWGVGGRGGGWLAWNERNVSQSFMTMTMTYG